MTYVPKEASDFNHARMMCAIQLIGSIHLIVLNSGPEHGEMSYANLLKSTFSIGWRHNGDTGSVKSID